MIPARDRVRLPDGLVYLDGNSLGPVVAGVPERVRSAVERDWQQGLIGSWNAAGWVDLAARVADRIAPLVGATPGELAVADSTSVDLFKVLAAALALRPDRRVIVVEQGSFPSDLYVTRGLAGLVGRDRLEVRAVARDRLVDALDDDVIALALVHVDYRTGARHDAASLTAAAHDVGALAIWDLAHSAGALDVDLDAWEADLAVGCTYKFLNGGPGAPGYVYVADRHAEVARSPIAGWWGHARPFDFAEGYTPARGAAGFQAGTPPILSLVALDAALDAFAGVTPAALERRAGALTARFLDAVTSLGRDDIEVVSPTDPAHRGAQVTLRHGDAYPVMQALIARGVVGDVRPPDLLRFGFAPLYVTDDDVERAVAALEQVLISGVWDDDRYRRRGTVT